MSKFLRNRVLATLGSLDENAYFLFTPYAREAWPTLESSDFQLFCKYESVRDDIVNWFGFMQLADFDWAIPINIEETIIWKM